MKDLKHSTKQRFVSLNFEHPLREVEEEILRTETGLPSEECRKLAEMGGKIREMKGYGLEEGVSTRLLVYAGRLMTAGLPAQDACEAAICQILTEEPDVLDSIRNIVNLYFGELMEEGDESVQSEQGKEEKKGDTEDNSEQE